MINLENKKELFKETKNRWLKLFNIFKISADILILNLLHSIINSNKKIAKYLKSPPYDNLKLIQSITTKKLSKNQTLFNQSHMFLMHIDSPLQNCHGLLNLKFKSSN